MTSRIGRLTYRLLLRVLPKSFRARHGAEMEELFDDAMSVHRRRGTPERILGWLSGFADVLELAVRLRSQRPSGGRTFSRGNMMGAMIQDVRFGLRSLGKAPGFTAVAIVTLALGIGANTGIFSLINAVLLRPPEHVTEPDRLVSIWTSDFSGPLYGSSSYMDYVDFRSRAPGIEDAVAVSPGIVNMPGDDGVSQILISEFVSGNYFEVLGVRPALGRWFSREEGDWASGTAVAVISEGMWARAFGSEPGVLGRTVRLSGQSVTIVGVAPEGFSGSLPLVTPDFWLPVSTQALIQGDQQFQRRGFRGNFIRARLAEGVSIETAQSQLDVVAAQLFEEDPGSWADVRNEGRRVTASKDSRLPPQVAGAVTGFALLLLAVTGIVLLIACANVANLTLARASRRYRELAIRLSLGAGRGRIIRQLVTESGIIGVAGGLAGAAAAYGAVRFAESYRPSTGIAVTVDLGVDSSVLLFSAAATLMTVLAVGLMPALRATRPDLVADLKEGSETARGRTGWFQVRNLLVISQVSASLVLLVGAGLFLKSLQAAMRIDPGFEPAGISTVSLNLAPEGYSREEAELFYEQLQERVRGLPGVEAVTTVDALPLTLLAGQRRGISVPDFVPLEGDDMEFQFFLVGPGYFALMENPIISGREFTAEDRFDGPLAVIVNEKLAEHLWPGEDPVGRIITHSGNEGQVVGLAADAAYRQLNEEARPAFFMPIAQNRTTAQTLVARTGVDRAAELLPALRREVAAIDPRLPISSLRTMEDAVAGTLLPQRVASWLLSIAGGLGLLLAAVGLYGVMSFIVAQRTREVGVRMALGASVGDVIRMVVGRGLRLAVVGSVLGLVLAGLVTRFIQSLLFGVSSLDFSVFGAMALAAVMVAGVASYVPARRAATVDPAMTLRED